MATVLLAGFTWLSIRSGDKRERRDRKERLLDKIIEWVTDIQKVSLEIDIPPVTGVSLDKEKIQASILLRYGIPFIRNEYIRAIARTAFRQELAGEVDNTINTFTAFLYLKGKEFGMQNPRESFRGTAIPIIDGVEREIGSDPKMLNDLLAKYNERIATAANSLLIKVGKVASGLC